MKDLEMNKQTIETTEAVSTAQAIVLPDVWVYNEMADQTSVKISLVEQIHAQLNQLEEMTHKRQFLLKEVLQYIAD